MREFLVSSGFLFLLAPGYVSAQKSVMKSAAAYQAQFSTWPAVRNEHGYAGPEGRQYVLEAASNTWMGPGRFLPITMLEGDFTMGFTFALVYGQDSSLNFTLSDDGSKYYSQLDIFFDIHQSGDPTFSAYENGVQNDFYVNIRRRFAERMALPRSVPAADWRRANTLSIERRGNRVSLYLNGSPFYSFLSTRFPVKKLGVGIAFKSRILLSSVTARTP